jgi:7-cyano-7-deazaguanine synthase in queuosine biosynthesis
MKALLVKSKSQTEMKFISDLLKKLGVSTRVLDAEKIEDYGMSALMKDVDRNKKVSRVTVMRKLKSK